MPWPISLHLILSILFLLLYWYVGTKITNGFVNGLRCQRRTVKRVVYIIAGLLILTPLMLFIGNFIDRPWTLRAAYGEYRYLDYVMFYPFWIGLICTIQLATVFIVIDVIRMVLFRIYRRDKERWFHGEGIVVFFCIVITLAYVPLKSYYDTSTIRVSRIEYPVPGLPQTLDGFRIVHVSDLQVDARTRGAILDEAVRQVRLLQPDLVVYTGDLITAGKNYIEEGAHIVGQMDTKYGSYACIGNHDMWVSASRVADELRRNGIIVANDTSIMLHINDAAIELSIVENYYGHPANRSLPMGERVDSADLHILATHQPSSWLVESASLRHIDIFLAGHTHGGQVALGPLWYPLVMSRIETPFVSGFYTAGSMLVSVTNGIGLTGAPLRFQAPAEISVIILRRR